VIVAPGETARRSAQGAFLLLVAVSLFWGLNWPVMKLVLGKIPVLPFRALCLAASGPAMLAIAHLRGGGIGVPRREWAPLLLAALFNVTLWHIFTGYGVLLMPAGRASIIAYTMPAWATLLGVFMLGERLTLPRLASLGFGMGGICALMIPDFHKIIAAPLGVLCMILAAVSWAAGTAVMKRFPWTGSMAALTGWQICLGGAPIVSAAVVIGPFPGLEKVDAQTIAALVYVVVFGMIIGQWGWFEVLRRLPVAVASISTLAIPVIGVVSSALLLGEPLGAAEIVALGLVLAALALVRASR
jgi:drug/metabolite transporter (DMT)-like permease